VLGVHTHQRLVRWNVWLPAELRTSGTECTQKDEVNGEMAAGFVKAVLGNVDTPTVQGCQWSFVQTGWGICAQRGSATECLVTNTRRLNVVEVVLTTCEHDCASVQVQVSTRLG
jgi:hypothetical protein